MKVTVLPVAASRIPTIVATTGWSVSARRTAPVSAPPVGVSTTLIPVVGEPLVTVMKDPSSEVRPPAGTPSLKNFVTNLGADARTLYTPGGTPRTRNVPSARLVAPTTE